MTGDATRRRVFDTSVVVSAVLFGGGQLAWLLPHWSAGRCTPLISPDTGVELMRVLHYSKFGLSSWRFDEALAAYLPYCELVDTIARSSVVCRDKKDQIFLDLAESGRADVLVSGDRDLLALAGKTNFAIESPEAYRRRVLSV